MAYFSKAFPKIFIGTGAVVGASVHPKDLHAGQIGLIDYKTNLSFASGTATKTNHPMAYLAIGSYHTKDKLNAFHGGYKESDKTKGINPSYVSKWWVSSPTAAVAHEIQIGFDGATACSAPSFEEGKAYYLRVEVKGSPVLRTMRRNLYRTYMAQIPCVTGTDCTDTCTSTGSQKLIFQSWADQLNADPLMSNFAKAYVGQDGAALPSGNVAYNVYTYTVADAGDEAALAVLQVNYPTYTTLTRLSYTGITSVYQVIKTGGAPANFNSIAWVDANYDVYKIPRNLCMLVDIASGSDGVAELAAANTFYTGLPNLVGSIIYQQDATPADEIGTCTAELQLTQLSSNFIQAGCDYFTEATFDAVPSYHGRTWGACPCLTETAEVAPKYFIRLVGSYTDDSFSNCSFEPTDLYEQAPVELQADLVDETNDICKFTALKVNTIKFPKMATGTGEELIREYITYMGYKQDIFLSDPRMREVFDNPILNTVKRGTSYKKYFILHNVPRFNNPTSTFDNDQYLIVVAFPSGVSTSTFETLLDTYIVSGANGVTLETK